MRRRDGLARCLAAQIGNDESEHRVGDIEIIDTNEEVVMKRALFLSLCLTQFLQTQFKSKPPGQNQNRNWK